MLTEGQRKANFEECDAKKRENCERIGRLKREVKELQLEFTKAKNNDETIVRAAHLDRDSTAYVKKRNLQEAKVTLDEDNIRLRKKLDLVKYQSGKQKKQLSLLLEGYKKLANGKPEKIGALQTSKCPLKQKIIRLENQLQRVNMMQMEADTIGKKYRSIKSNLKTDASFYTLYLDRLEENIGNQKNEIDRLQKVKSEAIKLRDTMQETLIEQEIEEMRAAKERETLIQEFRKCVDDRRIDLERLERSMFPPTRLTETRDDSDVDRKSQDDDDALQNELDSLEEVFAKLRNVTGVSKTEDVLNCFVTQQATKEKLKKMQMTIEEKKESLEKKKQQMIVEIEMQKFSETKDDDRNAEKLQELNKQIQEQCRLREIAVKQLKAIEDLFKSIKYTLLKLCDKFQKGSEMINFEASDTLSIMDIMQRLNDMVNEFIEQMGGLNQFNERMDQILNDTFQPISIESVSDKAKTINTEDQQLFRRFAMAGTPTGQLQVSEDEEEIPPRNLLKRQAQLLVDNKTRRKGLATRR